MAGQIPNELRDQVASAFRERVCERMEVAPFLHQRQVWCASDGLALTGEPDPAGVSVRTETSEVVLVGVRPRAAGRARFLADLGAFKIGKSYGAALWTSGFGAVPGARVSLVGLEYNICEPEFTYICEFLLSSRGMNLKAKSHVNRPRQGEMYLELQNGAVFECRSWERKESLKGKENDAYVYCLPLDAPVWMGDYSFKPIGSISPGDIVIGWERGHPERSRAKNPARYETERLTRAIVTQVHRKRDALIRVRMKSGRSLICTADHRWQTWTCNNDYATAKVGRVLCRIIDEPPQLTPFLQQKAAWLGGMYDGEGSRTLISQSPTHNGPLYKHLVGVLNCLGYEPRPTRQGVRWLGGRQAAVNFVNQTDSFRYRYRYADEAILGGRFREADPIVSIEPYAADAEVACITTTTGNFVAYGYGSHNCESYQLPGFECFTAFSQNLRARNGYAYFATTPDRPWVAQLHDLGHGGDPEWHCTCAVASDANPFTFDAKAKERDRALMTREQWQIHYEGKIGEFVGHVYNYQRGDRVFTATSHPQLFAGETARHTLAVPEGWEIVSGADTGTFYSGLLVAFSPQGDAFVLEEFPNYRYVSGRPEADQALSIPAWSAVTVRRAQQLGARPVFWADPNSQFKHELRNYGITLLPEKSPVETRSEITREYFEHGRIWLAPWLSVLPFELENARWPDEASAAGRFARVKDRDHTLDCLEHVLARRPAGQVRRPKEAMTWAESMGYRKLTASGNAHLGRN